MSTRTFITIAAAFLFIFFYLRHFERKGIYYPSKEIEFTPNDIGLKYEEVFFKTGDFEIGPFKIDLMKDNKVVETKLTNSIPITIKSVLDKNDKDIKPLKKLMEIKGNPFYILKYVFAFLVGVLLVILILMWNKSRKKRAGVPLTPILSPIDELDAKNENFSILLPILWDGELVIGGRNIELGKSIIIMAISEPKIYKNPNDFKNEIINIISQTIGEPVGKKE